MLIAFIGVVASGTGVQGKDRFWAVYAVQRFQ